MGGDGRGEPSTTATGSGPHVRLEGVSKRFGGVQAVLDVDWAVERGTIHALVGENGAGKSTIAKIVAGVLQHDSGTVMVDGREVRYRSPREALADGITLIAQELTLVPGRPVIENVFLGAEPHRLGIVDRAALAERYRELSERAGFTLPAGAPVRELRPGDQQKVEILRALGRDARLIVMDEPTAALGADEAGRLLAIVRKLADAGTTIVYISHNLDEVLRVAHTVTVMKDGRRVRTAATATESTGSLVTAMLGRTLEQSFPPRPAPRPDAPVVCAVEGLSRRGAFHDISLSVRSGEIVGLAGLIGSGRSEVARALFGAEPPDTGEVRLGGRTLRLRSPWQAVRCGIAMVPERRKEEGLIMGRSMTENVTLPHLPHVSRLGVLRPRQEARAAAPLLERVDVTVARMAAPVTTLSGGNQQKALFAKWLFRRPLLLIADEPTRGVDVGAKRAIYDLLVALAEEGMAVLLISSEIEEVLALANRVLVMRAGRIVASLEGEQATEDAVMRAAFAAAPAGTSTSASTSTSTSTSTGTGTGGRP